MQLFIFYLGLLIAALLLVYTTGKIITSFFSFNISKPINLFVSYSIGLLAILITYSVIKSRLHTINLGIIPLFFLLIFCLRKKINSPRFDFNSIKKDVVISLSILFPIFIFQSIFFINISSNTINAMNLDYWFYGNMADFLKLYGLETTFTDINLYGLNHAIQLNPYHYSELWLTAFFSNLFSTSAENIYVLVTIPLLITIYGIGIYSIFSETKIKRKYVFLVTILCLMIGGLYFPIYDKSEITNYFSTTVTNILGSVFQKLSFVAIYLLLAFILLYKNKKNYAIIVLAFLPFFAIYFFPAVLGGIALLIVWDWINARFSYKKIDWFSVGIIIYTALFIFLFYSIFNKAENAYVHLSNKSLLTKIAHAQLQIGDLKSFVLYVFVRFGGCFMLYFPYLILLSNSILKQKKILLMSCFIVLSGAIAFALTNGFAQASQLSINPYIVFNLLILFGALNFIENFESKKKINWLIASGLVVITSISMAYTTKIKKEESASFLTKNEQIIDAGKTFESIDSLLTENPCKILVFSNCDDFTYNVNITQWWYSFGSFFQISKHTNKTLFFTLANATDYFICNHAVTADDSAYYSAYMPVGYKKGFVIDKAKFIEDQHIKYVFVRNDASLPQQLQSKVLKSISSKDLGGIFYLLNQNQ
jgi:hypothetical protein